MSSLKRTQIFLTLEQRRRLRTWARLRKKTSSELIRAAIEECYIHRPTPEEFGAAFRQSFGAWSPRRKSSAAIVRELRRGGRLNRLLD